MWKGTSVPQMPGDAAGWRAARLSEPANNEQMNKGKESGWILTAEYEIRVPKESACNHCV